MGDCVDQAFTLCEQHLTPRVVEQPSALGRKRPRIGKDKDSALEKFCQANWSVQVNDKRYDSVSLFIEQFFAQGLSDAKRALIEGSRDRNS
jgi:hypothetical protein